MKRREPRSDTLISIFFSKKNVLQKSFQPKPYTASRAYRHENVPMMSMLLGVSRTCNFLERQPKQNVERRGMKGKYNIVKIRLNYKIYSTFTSKQVINQAYKMLSHSRVVSMKHMSFV